MTSKSLLNELWQATLRQLGGAAAIEASAREARAFLRPRAVKSATDLLRLILAYCLGGMGLRSTSAWAASAGLADLSNVALLQRLRNCGAWIKPRRQVARRRGGARGRRAARSSSRWDDSSKGREGSSGKQRLVAPSLRLRSPCRALQFYRVDRGERRRAARSDARCQRGYPYRRPGVHASRSFGAYFGAGRRYRRAHGLEGRALARRGRQAVRYSGRSRGCGKHEVSTGPSGSRAKKLHRWPFGLLPSASRRRRPKRRGPKRGRLQRRKAMPSPAARWPPPRGSFLLRPLTQ